MIARDTGTGERDLQVADNAALTGSAATGRPSVASTRRLLFMRVIIVLASVRFFRSQKRASMKARSTTRACCARGEGLRTPVIVAQQERLMAAAGIDVDILGDPSAG